jgi:hypothetical protein
MGLDMYLYARVPLGSVPLDEDSRDNYVSGWDHCPDIEKAEYRAVLAATGFGECINEGSPHAYISNRPDGKGTNADVCVAYWRKANQVHSWFVEHVQDGVDECQDSVVTLEQLRDLLDRCERILASTKLVPNKVRNGTVCGPHTGGEWVDVVEDGKVVDDPILAIELLPSRSGFFFGSTDYDEGYLEDLRHTIEIIDHALSLDKEYDFQYRASW